MNVFALPLLIRVALALSIALGGYVYWRSEIRRTAKTEITQKLTTTEINKTKKANNAQDRIRTNHRAKPDSLRGQDDGFRRND